MTALLAGQRVYLDADVFIYALEDHDVSPAIAQNVLKSVFQTSAIGMTSELTLAEVLVGPSKSGDTAAIELYEELFADQDKIALIPITPLILRKDAELRAHRRTKLPDATHLASAMNGGCSTMVTRDRRMKPLQELSVVRLDELFAGHGQ